MSSKRASASIAPIGAIGAYMHTHTHTHTHTHQNMEVVYIGIIYVGQLYFFSLFLE